MKKKKLSQALPKKISPSQLIDFCFYLQTGLHSGLTIPQTIELAIPFLESPLKESAQNFSQEISDDTQFIDALCAFANSHSEDHFRRLIKMLIFTTITNSAPAPFLKLLIRDISQIDTLESSPHGELTPSAFRELLTRQMELPTDTNEEFPGL